MICKLSRGDHSSGRAEKNSKKSEKSCEKSLTNQFGYDRINKLSERKATKYRKTEKIPNKTEKSCRKCLTEEIEFCYNRQAHLSKGVSAELLFGSRRLKIE